MKTEILKRLIGKCVTIDYVTHVAYARIRWVGDETFQVDGGHQYPLSTLTPTDNEDVFDCTWADPGKSNGRRWRLVDALSAQAA